MVHDGSVTSRDHFRYWVHSWFLKRWIWLSFNILDRVIIDGWLDDYFPSRFFFFFSWSDYKHAIMSCLLGYPTLVLDVTMVSLSHFRFCKNRYYSWVFHKFLHSSYDVMKERTTWAKKTKTKQDSLCVLWTVDDASCSVLGLLDDIFFIFSETHFLILLSRSIADLSQWDGCCWVPV